MKRYFLTFVLSIIALISVNAQDILVKKNGEELMTRIVKVTETEIEYKKWTFQDGPTYTVLKSAIAKIKYSNGETEVFETPATTNESSTEVLNYVDDKSKSLIAESYVNQMNNMDFLERDDLMRRSRAYRAGGIVCLVTGVLSAGSGILIVTNGGPGGLTGGMIATGAVLIGVGWGLCFSAADKRIEATSMYVSTLYDTKIKLGKGKELTPGIKMFNTTTGARHDLALGVGATVNF